MEGYTIFVSFLGKVNTFFLFVENRAKVGGKV